MPSVPLRAALAAVSALPLVAFAPSTASAAPSRPAVPTGMRVVGLSHSAVTVTVGRTAGATSYRLYVSTRRSDVYLADLSRARVSAARPVPRVGLTGLRYTGAAFYYRVGAFRGTQGRWTATIGSFRLAASTPTGLRTTDRALSWTSSGATSVQLQQAADPAFTRSARTYAASPPFTPYGLVLGQRAWFRVRALNSTSASPWSAPVSTVPTTAEQPVSVMTYNLLEGRFAGTTVPGGEVIAPWARRRDGVIALVRRSAPDVLAVQEGAGWVGTPEGYGGTRQVDDLAARLGDYTVARTEIAPDTHGYRRTGVYVLYRTGAWQAVGDGGHWNTGTDGTEHFAAYQLLRNVGTGARVVVVSPHLPAGAGREADLVRQQETRNLLRQGHTYAASVGAPIVYAGDYNSHAGGNHVVDGPGIEMHHAGYADAAATAQVRTDTRWNSCNQYLRTPPATGSSIDHVYAPPGVPVRSAAVVLRLTGGHFVGVIPSDHNPLLAGLTIAYRPAQ